MLPHRHLNALQTVGFSEMFDYFDGAITREEAIELIKRNSRRYAKRQMTWFSAKDYVQWLDVEDDFGEKKQKTFEEIVNIAKQLFRNVGFCGKI